MRIVLDQASQLAPNIWLTHTPPHQMQMLGSPKAVIGSRSVLLAESFEYDAEKKMLMLDPGTLTILNLGTTDETIVMAPDRSDARPIISHRDAPEGSTFGPGDRGYLNLVETVLMGSAKEAAKSILITVRKHYPGDLQKGLRLNFKNTPDNFWYVVVQPRVQSLSITVRGYPDLFRPSGLQIKEDRPGYSRFRLRHPAEVDEAFSIIEKSKKR